MPFGLRSALHLRRPETPIATPSGDRPIASLRTGDLVFSIDRNRLVAVPIVRTQRTEVSGHHVLRMTLRSGSILQISPGHPTANGRRLGDLAAGDRLDGVEIIAAELVPYRHEATHDILPASDTAAYFAGGVLIGSTLAESPRYVTAPTAPFDPASDVAPISVE